jgi:hypothetical protein
MKKVSLKDARASLLSVLARRAEEQARWSHPFRRVSWRTIEAGLFVVRARERRLAARRVTGAAPAWMLDLALAAGLGRGVSRPMLRGARGRLRRLLSVARHLHEWGGGLRFGELLALTGMGERELHGTLAWASRQGVLVDCGESGWFFGPWREESVEIERLARA